MTNVPSTRSAAPNGAEIKRLRLTQNKSQKAFVADGGLQLRTLQRAEQGVPISADSLQAIASQLQVPLEQILRNGDPKQAEAEPDKPELIRLQRVGARQLIDWIYERPDGIGYSFRVDPEIELAEHIAGIIEFCDGQKRKPSDPWYAPPAAKIRAIGALNERINLILQHGIGLFAERYYYYQQEIKTADSGESETQAFVPDVKSRILVDFADAAVPHVQYRFPAYAAKKVVFEECARLNLDALIEPKTVVAVSLPFDDGFSNFYEQVWTQNKKVGTTPLQKLLSETGVKEKKETS